MTAHDAPTRLDRSDTIGMYATVGIALVAVVATVWQVVVRLGEVLPGRDVPVLVPFVDEAAELPIGPDGAPVTVAVDQAVVTVADPAPATAFALIAEPLVHGAAIIAGAVLFALFCWNLARGRAFSRTNVRIVLGGVGVLAVGWFVGTILTTMTVNGALAAVSDHTYEGITFSTNWGFPFAILALGAVGAAFQIAARLQRDTEGLV